MSVKIESYLTQKEIKTRKRWLIYVLLVFCFNLIVFGGTLIDSIREQNPAYQPFELFLGFLLGSSWCLLCYYFCYRKQTTFLLTLTLCSQAPLALILISSIATALHKGVDPYLISLGVLLVGLTTAPLWTVIILTYKLRKINKMLRCHQKYPKESDELIHAFRNSLNMDSLGRTFDTAIAKTPFLKHLIYREWKMKKRELKKPLQNDIPA